MPGSVHALRLHNLLLAGALTSAQLDAALSSPAIYGAFLASLRQRSVVDAITSSTHALPVVLASQCAVRFTEAAIEFPGYFSRLFAKTETRLQIYNSDAVLAAIAASAAAIAALRAELTYKVIGAPTGPYGGVASISGITGPSILVGCSATVAGTVTLTGRRAGSVVGTLSLAVAVGTTASTSNVMAITSPATVALPPSYQTIYLGIIPV